MSADDRGFIFGNITRELWALFEQHGGSRGVLSQREIRNALNQINMFPSKSQVFETVQCACEGSGRVPVDHITFGEFCVLVTELQEHYRRSPSPPAPRSLLKDKALLEEKRRKRRLSVFLGGSCNPTTWRHDVAIPFLKRHGITFYNPQVGNWRPELMEIEDQAKQSAELLLFVIDNQTRSTASMVEAAYLAGCGRQLILVIKSFNGAGDLVAGEAISQREFEDLSRSHVYLTDLVERQGIPVFFDIDTALQCSCKAAQQNVKVSDLSMADGAQPVKFTHVRVADKLVKLKDAFSAVDSSGSGKLSLQDVNLAYKTIVDEDVPVNVLSSLSDRTFTFEEFCCLVAEHRYKRKNMLRRLMGGIVRMPGRFADWMRGLSSPPLEGDHSIRNRDVFLGGTCGPATWREDTAIPLLKKHGISYYNPQVPEWSKRYIPLEAAVKDNCRVLLYVITDDTRGITSMLEAGHYIGQGCNLILCVQNMPEGSVVEEEKLTSNCVKDYNRARCYLSDLANRDGVPVFDNIVEAVSCVIKKLRGGACRD